MGKLQVLQRLSQSRHFAHCSPGPRDSLVLFHSYWDADPNTLLSAVHIGQHSFIEELLQLIPITHGPAANQGFHTAAQKTACELRLTVQFIVFQRDSSDCVQITECKANSVLQAEMFGCAGDLGSREEQKGYKESVSVSMLTFSKALNPPAVHWKSALFFSSQTTCGGYKSIKCNKSQNKVSFDISKGNNGKL